MKNLISIQSNKYRNKVSKKELIISKLTYEMEMLKKQIDMQNQDEEDTFAQAEEMEMDFNYEDDLTKQIEDLEKQNKD